MYHNKTSFDNSITLTPIKVELSQLNDTQPPAATSNIVPTGTGAIPKDNSKSGKTPKPTPVRRPPPTLDNFWPNIMADVRSIQQVDAKHQALPLARIKKIMKLDDNAKMIAAEAPLLFAKACEYFIQEITMRAWIHTEESKRRTLQRSDIAQAIANYDQFDFLIDIVPREDIKPSTTSSSTKKDATTSSSNNTTATSTNESIATTSTGITTATGTTANVVRVEQPEMSFGVIPQEALTPANAPTQSVQTIMQTATPQQLQIIQQPTAAAHSQPMQYLIAIPGAQGQPQLVQQLQFQQQLPQGLGINLVQAQPQQLILTTGPNGQFTATPASAQHQQTALIQNLAAAQQQQQQQQHFQVLQQVVTPSGELANVPITINANQLNLLRLQLQQQQQQQHLQQQQQQHQTANATNIYLTTGQQHTTSNNVGDRTNTTNFRPNC